MTKETLGNVDNVESDEKTKEQRIADFGKAVVALEGCIQPFKDQMKDLKESYESNGWLSKEELKMVIKALRMLRDNTDLDQLTDFYKTLQEQTGMKNE